MSIAYYHVDAFTDRLFSGNPAGICILDSFPAAEVMQQIAAENRHSETAFVVRRSDGDFDLRWFTPTVEDDLCGHATLASAYVLHLRKQDAWPVRFYTASGILIVDKHRDDGFEMSFPAMPAQNCDVPAKLLRALGVKSAQVMKSRDYLVVLDGATQVRDLSVDVGALSEIEMGTGGAIVTAPGEGDVDYVCRFFPPSVGISEDPATGSIQCTLAPYWADRLNKRELRVQQLSPRGGSMRCTLAGDRVKIAGHARLYLQGVLEI
jgi:PhzF family phenazine biosynthesis protein